MGKRVMVVDDSTIVTKVVSGVLSSAGYNVEAVNSPFGVSGVFRRFKPHMVIMDLNIPGLNGSKIIEILSSKDYDFKFGVVVYSSEDEEALKKAERIEGVCGTIRKGVSNEEFLSSVNKFMGQHMSVVAPETGGEDAVEFLRNATS